MEERRRPPSRCTLNTQQGHLLPSSVSLRPTEKEHRMWDSALPLRWLATAVRRPRFHRHELDSAKALGGDSWPVPSLNGRYTAQHTRAPPRQKTPQGCSAQRGTLPRAFCDAPSSVDAPPHITTPDEACKRAAHVPQQRPSRVHGGHRPSRPRPWQSRPPLPRGSPRAPLVPAAAATDRKSVV